MKKIIIAMMAAVSLLNFSGCDSLDMEPVSSIPTQTIGNPRTSLRHST